MNEHAKLPPQPTSSMKHFDILVGEWKMVGTHPEFPSAAHGHSSFSWLMDGGLRYGTPSLSAIASPLERGTTDEPILSSS